MNSARFCIVIVVVAFSFFSCKSDKEIIQVKTREIIRAIRDSNFTAFEQMLVEDDIKVSNENDLFYFNATHDYMSRYFKKDEEIPFGMPYKKKLNLALAQSNNFYVNEVAVPLFEGFDSTNGSKKAVLKLDFVSTSRFSNHTKFQSFLLDQDLDVPYRLAHPNYKY